MADDKDKVLYIVQVPRGTIPCQIHDFPEKCERHKKGSLRIAPGTLELTKDELHHIRKHHKDIGRRLIEVRKSAISKAEKAEKTKAKKAKTGKSDTQKPGKPSDKPEKPADKPEKPEKPATGGSTR